MLLALAIVAFAVIARRAPGLALAAAREHPDPALALGVPVARLRLGAFAASAAIAGLAGALTRRARGGRRPVGIRAVVSFTLFVAVIIGGARRRSGRSPGSLVISAFSHAAEQVGALRGLPPGRLEEMLTGYGLLLVLGLGGVGLLPTVRGWWGRRRESSPDVLPPPTSSRSRAWPTPSRSPHAGSPSASKASSHSTISTSTSRPGAVHALIGPNGSGKTTALRVLGGRAQRRIPARSPSGDDRLEAATQRERAQPRCRGHAADDCDLPRPDGARAHPGRRRPPAPALRPVSDALPDAEGEGGGSEGGAAGPRSARAGRPAGRPRQARSRALGARTAAAHARLGACHPAARALAGRAGGRRVVASSSTVWSTCSRRCAAKGSALLLIEHNLRFVRRVADQVTVLEAGRQIASGTLAEVAANEAVRVAYLGRQTL